MSTATRSGSGAYMSKKESKIISTDAISTTRRNTAKVTKRRSTTKLPQSKNYNNKNPKAKKSNIKLRTSTLSSKQSPKSKRRPKLSTTLSPSSHCIAGGPKGPKVYDESGYLLSYSKCAASRRPPQESNIYEYFEMLDREHKEGLRKAEIMGTPREQVSPLSSIAWEERVARELGIMYHEVEMEHFEELAKRGFVAKEGEFDAANMGEEERDRLWTLARGSAFRK